MESDEFQNVCLLFISYDHIPQEKSLNLYFIYTFASYIG